MGTGIMILGPSGAGKTALGKLVADELGFSMIDIDDYIWRKDTKKAFTVMYSRQEKISRLMDAVNAAEHFVMVGSMDSFHEYFDPFFELAVYLYADEQLRLERVHARELEQFGSRILKGGDMYEEHRKFLEDVAGYDHGFGGTTSEKHQDWLNCLTCRVIRLDGSASLEENGKAVIHAYGLLQHSSQGLMGK